MSAPPRSWMFVPASQPTTVRKALDSAAEAVIIDLEDSVPEDAKAAARQGLAALLPQHARAEVWLRVNAHDSAWHAQDVATALSLPGLRGILVPKVESAQGLVPRGGLARGNAPDLRQAALMESARGVLSLQGLLAAGCAIDMVMFGGAENADLQADLQCDWSPEGTELLHARQHTLLCARAYEGVVAVDGVYARLEDLEGLAADTRLSRRLGYRARAAVHPRQLAAINDTYAATAEERERAQQVRLGFEAALQQGRAAVNIAGKLVDYAMYKAACRTLGRPPAAR